MHASGASVFSLRVFYFSDGGTEIAFVLDGSGSIEADDFQRAKDFISNMTKNIWENCFSVSTGTSSILKTIYYKPIPVKGLSK